MTHYNGKIIKLTYEQNEGVNKMLSFIDDNDNIDNEFLLTGTSGSGKTSIMQNFLKNIKYIKNYKIIIATPTHKACNVINNILEGKYTVVTIHKLLGYSKDIDENGNIVFKRKYDSMYKEFNLIIFDECSMINKYMYEKINTDFYNSKLIYLGDSYQLPPIKETISPTFNIENNYNLSKVMRHKNEILKFNTYLRKNINKKNLELKKVYKKDYNKSKELLYTENPVDFINLINIAFKKDKDAKLLCWTNKQVEKYNDKIRKELYGKNLKKYCNGEKLLVTQHYITLETDGITKYISRIFNSNDELIANTVNIVEKDYKYLYKIITPQILHKLDIKLLKLWKFDIVGDLYYHKILREIRNNLNKRLCNDISDVIINYSKSDDSLFCFFFKIHEDSLIDFNKILSKYHEDALEAAEKFRESNNNQNLKTYAKQKWIDYYKLKEHFDAPITYNYSSTIHRAQGSQYDYVFIDVEDINKNRKITERNKLLYVASSRACKKLILFE